MYNYDNKTILLIEDKYFLQFSFQPPIGTIMFADLFDQEFPESLLTERSQFQEESLIVQAKVGDLEAFNQLVLTHQDNLYWWILSLVGDDRLAMDLTQSTFVAAYEKIATFQQGSFRAWLFRIARNRSYDELRHRRRFPKVSLDQSINDAGEINLAGLIQDETPHPEEIIIQSEQSDTIGKLIGRLSEPYQEVIRLVDLNGLDYREAASLLKLPLGTLKSRLLRARLKLRQLMLRSEHFGRGS
jgi:RNA polymerase sigma-70 factor, ECF subfamily